MAGRVVVVGRVVVGGGAGFGAGRVDVAAVVGDDAGALDDGGAEVALGGVVRGGEGKDGVAVTTWEATGLEVGTAWGAVQPAPSTTTRTAA